MQRAAVLNSAVLCPHGPQVALDISKLQEFTGRDKPDVIT